MFRILPLLAVKRKGGGPAAKVFMFPRATSDALYVIVWQFEVPYGLSSFHTQTPRATNAVGVGPNDER